MQRVGKNLQSLVEGELRRAILGDFPALPAFAAPEDLPLDQRSVGPLKRGESRECLLHREPCRIARIASRHHGVDRVIEELPAEPSRHEPGDALLGGTKGSFSTASFAPGEKSGVVRNPRGDPGISTGRLRRTR